MNLHPDSLETLTPHARQESFFVRHHVDLPLLSGLLMTLCLSLFVLYSASGQHPDMLMRQLTRTVAAFVLMIAIAQLPPKIFAKVSFYLFLAGIVLLVMVEIAGDISKGAQRWLNLGFIRLQPSEIFKVVMPLTMATFLSRDQLPPRPFNMLVAMFLVALPTVLTLLQPDLGTASLIAVSGFIAIFIAGLSWWWIAAGAGLIGAALPIMWSFVLHDYQKQRIFTLLDPTSDPLGAGYHIIQSKIAIGSGSIYGKGWLQGSQSQLDFLPEPHTDFIFAVLAEETGLIGFVVLISVYCFIIGRCIYITLHANDNFGRILCAALMFTFVFYIFVNIGMVSGILPVVGVPLPLISYGGTAMISLCIGFGMVMSVHTHKRALIFRQP